MLLAESGRTLSKDLVSLFRHNLDTPNVLERLVQEIHANKELCSYMFLNHPGSEDMLWGIMKLLNDQDSRIAGNAAYVIGSLAEGDPGKRRIVRICTEHNVDARRILPSLTSMLDMTDPETVMNAAGTMGTLAEDEDCRMWMLREDCLDEAIRKLTKLLSCKDKCTASNAALVLARLTIAEEGCARILNLRSSRHTLVMLCRALGTDETGCGMNAAFAIGRLCDLEAGCARILSLPDSNTMIDSLISMLRGADTGCCKNACFALSCVASTSQGHARLLGQADIESVVRMLCFLLSSHDEECVWFAAMMLRTLASQKSGCLFLRKQPSLEPSLKAVLERSGLKEDTREEVEATRAILETLPKPEPPALTVESAHTILVTWKAIQPSSGLIVNYELYQDNTLVYSGPKTGYIASDLRPVSRHQFYLRTCTEGDDSPFSNVVTVTTAESVPSAPQSLRVVATTTSQIKITWDPPEAPNGVLTGYQVVAKGKTTSLGIGETHFILSSLPPDTDFTFQVFALTSKGRGEAAVLTARTDDLASHAPTKPIVHVLGRHELLVQWDNPPRPLGRINSFEVRINGTPIYNGVERTCTATSLRPNTEYTVTVSAWCSEGRCESEPAKKTTAREIYNVKEALQRASDEKNRSNKKLATKPKAPAKSKSKSNVPSRKPLYPRDRKNTRQDRGLKRAKTADTLKVPTAANGQPQTRPHRAGSSVEGRNKAASAVLARNKNGGSQESIARRALVKRSSRQRDGLSSSTDSLRDTRDNGKASGDDSSGSSRASSASSDRTRERARRKQSSSNKNSGDEARRPGLTKRPSQGGSAGAARDRTTPQKGKARTSSLSAVKPNTAAQDAAVTIRVPDQPSRGVEVMSGRLDSLSLASRTAVHVGDEKPPKPVKKTQFAVSFDELKQVHRVQSQSPQQTKRSKGLTNSNGRKTKD